MLKIAIVGNIASGKSTVEDVLLEQNFPVLDTDKVCHRLLVELPQIASAFKEFDIFENGKISREKLGKLVFSDNQKKKTLEDILYPQVKIEISNFFEQNEKSDFAFVSIPLLFESGMENLFDRILFIYCEDEIRLNRLILRNGYSRDYAQKRLDAQLPQELKIKKADWVIYNNSTKEELRENVLNLIEQIR